ncbi:MAG: hypothetical protein HYZ94_03725, partial [Candidatus Omnitrophica bacterium]|nr:hypothetical protein [Candidatus Omnitrophota bacterium]
MPSEWRNGLYRYDFEKPLAELDHRLQEFRKDAARKGDVSAVRQLEAQVEGL